MKMTKEIRQLAVDAATRRMWGREVTGVPETAEEHCAALVDAALDEAWPLIEKRMRAILSNRIAIDLAANRAGTLDRPKYEAGGYLNDGDWAVAIVRGEST